MSFTVRELRAAYAHMPTTEFVEIYEKHRDSQKLLDVLDEAEGRARQKKAEEDAAIRQLELKFSASEQHHRLHFAVTPDIDVEHAQAILMYGFVMPGQQGAFIGSKMIPKQHVAHNVRNKLGYRYSEKKFHLALSYLEKEGIFFSKEARIDTALSLKPSTSDKGVKSHGAQILRITLDYVRNKC